MWAIDYRVGNSRGNSRATKIDETILIRVASNFQFWLSYFGSSLFSPIRKVVKKAVKFILFKKVLDYRCNFLSNTYLVEVLFGPSLASIF